MATKIWTGTVSGDWGVAGNWSPSGVPVAADDVYFTDNSVSVTAGLNQSAVTLTSLTIDQSYTGTLGGSSSDFLQVGATTLRIGYHEGQSQPVGSGRLNIDLGSPASTVLIVNSKQIASDTNKTPIRLKAANASTNIFLSGGKVSLADDPLATSTVGSVVLSSVATRGASQLIYIGKGTTITTLTVGAGEAILYAAATTVNVDGGSARTEGAGTITTMNIRAGEMVSNSSGTITTANAEGGIVHFDRSAQPRTVTTLNIKRGGSIRIDRDVVTLTSQVTVNDSLPLTLSAT